MSFEKKINELNQNKFYPFHMPGHKRNVRMEQDAYLIDITEIDGYDNLHNPDGMIRELEERISSMYGADKSYVLINGSTCGILAAVSAVTEYGDRILMTRNSHKAAFNGVMIRGLEADYIYPEYVDLTGESLNEAVGSKERSSLSIAASISIEEIEALLNKGNYKAVYITSPTYEGVVSDIEKIAEVVHSYGIPLIVDEAHGAHFGLSENFPKSAIELGADIVVQSIHKTLAGMTQTAVLHINRSNNSGAGYINVDKLEFYLRLYQSSSPSYVLMASVDRCYRVIEADRDALFRAYYERLEGFYDSCRSLVNVNIFPMTVDSGKIFTRDCGKIIIYAKGFSGKEIYDYLRKNHRLQLEMSCGGYALAMTSYMDTYEGFTRLFRALKDLDELADARNKPDVNSQCGAGEMMGDGESENGLIYINEPLTRHCTIAKALESEVSLCRLEEGIIAGDYVYIYPPGIPFIVPGEYITNEAICAIMKYVKAGHEVHGVVHKDNTLYIKAIR